MLILSKVSSTSQSSGNPPAMFVEGTYSGPAFDNFPQAKVLEELKAEKEELLTKVEDLKVQHHPPVYRLWCDVQFSLITERATFEGISSY